MFYIFLDLLLQTILHNVKTLTTNRDDVVQRVCMIRVKHITVPQKYSLHSFNTIVTDLV